MKNKIIWGVFALAVLATAGYGVSKNINSEVPLSDLALENIEALAQGESGGSGGGTYITCYCARLKDSNCAANNSGPICAGGENIHCWEYNRNCN